MSVELLKGPSMLLEVFVGLLSVRGFQQASRGVCWTVRGSQQATRGVCWIDRGPSRLV